MTTNAALPPLRPERPFLWRLAAAMGRSSSLALLRLFRPDSHEAQLDRHLKPELAEGAGQPSLSDDQIILKLCWNWLMEHRFRIFTLSFLLFGLVVSLFSFYGCASVLDPGPAPTRVQLNPDMPARVAAAPFAKQLVVALPVAGRDIDTDSIALIFNQREVRYLSGMRWTGTVPYIVQRGLMDALEASGGLKGVADEGAGISANVKLLCDVRQFALRYADEKAAPSAEFAASLKLVNLNNGLVLSAKNLDISVPAGGRDNAALIKAMEQALSQGLAQATPWVLENMKRTK